jgi:hypothetical protein
MEYEAARQADNLDLQVRLSHGQIDDRILDILEVHRNDVEAMLAMQNVTLPFQFHPVDRRADYLFSCSTFCSRLARALKGSYCSSESKHSSARLGAERPSLFEIGY